jgi:hypothetical protein
MRRIRRHLTFANVASAIALFIAISGGTAVALSGTNTVFTDDVADDTQPASGGNPAGGLVAADLRPNSVGTSEAANNSLTGADIKDRSGVDTCQTPLTAKFGPICAGSDGGTRNWDAARSYCAGFGLRLPTVGEAVTLAVKYDVPGVSATQFFWTDEELFVNTFEADTVKEDGTLNSDSEGATNQTVCVTDPSA